MPQGAVDGVEPADFFVIRSASPETIRENLLEVVTQRIPARFGLDPKRDIQVLAPMKKGAVGTRTLNEVLRAALNEPDKPKLARFGQEFSEGDKVLQTVNNYKKDVFNGDIGVVASVNLEDGVLTVDFDGRLVEYTAKELDNLLLAYATTIHKSQGSEYPAVVIPVSTEQHVMLERSLLYTAVTRGRKVVVLLCQEAALSRAVSTVKARVRMTGLAKRLQDEKGGGSV
jgi:exodeoxyribonuclease V alpha subunit